MPKAVLDDRPIWPVTPAETPPCEADPDTDQAPAPDDSAPQIRTSADSFEGFGSFSG